MRRPPRKEFQLLIRATVTRRPMATRVPAVATGPLPPARLIRNASMYEFNTEIEIFGEERPCVVNTTASTGCCCPRANRCPLPVFGRFRRRS